MTNEEIKAGSKLLAEFEGACFPEKPTNQYDRTFLYKDGKRWKQVDKLTYHTDYNELHRVWIKVRGMKLDDPKFRFQKALLKIVIAECDAPEELFKELVKCVECLNSLKPKEEKK